MTPEDVLLSLCALRKTMREMAKTAKREETRKELEIALPLIESACRETECAISHVNNAYLFWYV